MAYITANRARIMISAEIRGHLQYMVGLDGVAQEVVGSTYAPDNTTGKSGNSVQYVSLSTQPIGDGGFKHVFNYADLSVAAVGGSDEIIGFRRIPIILVSNGRSIDRVAFIGINAPFNNKIVITVPIETPIATKDTMYFFENIEFTVV